MSVFHFVHYPTFLNLQSVSEANISMWPFRLHDFMTFIHLFIRMLSWLMLCYLSVQRETTLKMHPKQSSRVSLKICLFNNNNNNNNNSNNNSIIVVFVALPIHKVGRFKCGMMAVKTRSFLLLEITRWYLWYSPTSMSTFEFFIFRDFDSSSQMCLLLIKSWNNGIDHGHKTSLNCKTLLKLQWLKGKKVFFIKKNGTRDVGKLCVPTSGVHERKDKRERERSVVEDRDTNVFTSVLEQIKTSYSTYVILKRTETDWMSPNLPTLIQPFKCPQNQWCWQVGYKF